MKPLGLDQALRVVHPTRAQDAIYNAVETAIDSGMTVRQFLQEARNSWDEYLSEKRKSDDQTFGNAFK